MDLWVRRLYRLTVAGFLMLAVVLFGPSPETAITAWNSIWILLICWLWAGFAGQIAERLWQLIKGTSVRGDLALSLAILCLGFSLIVLIWLALDGIIGFWPSIFAMVPVFAIYSLIDWIVRHRDDFDTSIER